MARPLRIEYSGAVYHIKSRGNARKDIFFDDADRTMFLEILAQVVDRFTWLCHAYCLMNNHYHLLVETVDATLAREKKGSGLHSRIRPFFRDALRDDFNRREVEADVISDLLKHVVAIANGIADTLIACPPIGAIGEERLKAWPGRVTLTAQDVGIERGFRKSRLHPLNESVAAEQASLA